MIGYKNANIFLVSLAIMRWISSTATGSTPAKGSSSKIKLGSVAKARAISVRLRSPPDKQITSIFRMCPKLNSSIKIPFFQFVLFLII